MLRFHTHTSGVSLTAQQPENNIVRVAYQVLAAALGGAQSIAACSFDEALALPTEKSVRVSLRTQQIVEHEAGVTDTVDPLGGSYYVEALTENMTREIKELITKIDDMGGAVAAVEKGFVQKEIEARAYAIQKEIQEKERTVVGLNEYQVAEKVDIALSKTDPHVYRKQLERLRTLKSNRDNPNVERALEDIRKAAEGNRNLMPCFIEAVKAYATLGEICGVLKQVFGEYRQARTI
jgi:methylmalonyl-CoA mutase N-terminal domain/subunit